MYNTASPQPKVPPLRQQPRNSKVMSDVSGGSVSTSVRPGSQDKARDLLPLSMVIPGDPIMNSFYVFIMSVFNLHKRAIYDRLLSCYKWGECSSYIKIPVLVTNYSVFLWLKLLLSYFRNIKHVYSDLFCYWRINKIKNKIIKFSSKRQVIDYCHRNN